MNNFQNRCFPWPGLKSCYRFHKALTSRGKYRQLISARNHEFHLLQLQKCHVGLFFWGFFSKNFLYLLCPLKSRPVGAAALRPCQWSGMPVARCCVPAPHLAMLSWRGPPSPASSSRHKWSCCQGKGLQQQGVRSWVFHWVGASAAPTKMFWFSRCRASILT